MIAKVLYHDGSLATVASFLTENLATQFDLSKATSISITLVEKNGTEGVYLIQVR